MSEELSVYEVYGSDKEYQEFMTDFNKKKDRLEIMAKQGHYDKEHLQQVGNKLVSDLQAFIRAHRGNRLSDRQNKMNELEKTKQKIGYEDRKDEAKELELRFNIASDFDLKNMVNNLESEDLLELTLLQKEMKDRNLDEAARVRTHIQKNELDGMTKEQKEEYERLKEETNILTGMGTSFVVGDGSFTTVDRIQKDLQELIKKVPAENQKKSVNETLFELG